MIKNCEPWTLGTPIGRSPKVRDQGTVGATIFLAMLSYWWPFRQRGCQGSACCGLCNAPLRRPAANTTGPDCHCSRCAALERPCTGASCGTWPQSRLGCDRTSSQRSHRAEVHRTPSAWGKRWGPHQQNGQASPRLQDLRSSKVHSGGCFGSWPDHGAEKLPHRCSKSWVFLHLATEPTTGRNVGAAGDQLVATHVAAEVCRGGSGGLSQDGTRWTCSAPGCWVWQSWLGTPLHHQFSSAHLCLKQPWLLAYSGQCVECVVAHCGWCQGNWRNLHCWLFLSPPVFWSRRACIPIIKSHLLLENIYQGVPVGNSGTRELLGKVGKKLRDKIPSPLPFVILQHEEVSFFHLKLHSNHSPDSIATQQVLKNYQYWLLSSAKTNLRVLPDARNGAKEDIGFHQIPEYFHREQNFVKPKQTWEFHPSQGVEHRRITIIDRLWNLFITLAAEFSMSHNFTSFKKN